MSVERQKTILLVDDEAIIALAEKVSLEKYGYAVIIAHSGEEAVALVKKTPGIDLVLMDINLGSGMDGTEAAAIILKQRDLPVVFLSSHAEPEVVEKTEKITSYGYVLKGSSVTVLDASIKMAFKLFEAKIHAGRKEAALAHSHELMRYIIEHMHGAVAVHDRELRYVYVSQRYLAEYNVKEHDIIGRHHYDVFPDLPQKWRDVHQRALAGEISSAEDDPYKREDGSLEWTRWECRPWYEADGSIGGIIVYTEVTTERKRVERKLAQNLDLLTKLARLVPGVIYQYRLDPDGRSAFPYSSPGMNDIYEVTPEEVRDDATPVFARLHPDDYDKVAGAIQASALTLNTFHCEFRVLLPRQGLRWRWSQAHPERLPDGGTLWHGIIIDVTERKLAEEELKASEALAQALLRTIPDMLFRVDHKGIFLDYRADSKSLYDQSGESFIGKNYREILPPDLSDLISAKIRSALETGALQTFTYQLPVPGQGIRDFEARMVASGANEAMAIVRDMTGNNRAESQKEAALETLRAAEERWRDILFSMADWVWEVNEKGVYTYSSDKGLDLLGASRGDIVGKTPFDFMPPEEAKRVGAIFARIIANKEVIRDLENWNVGKNGERICLLTNGVPILDETGNLKGYRGVDKDITGRQRAERALQENNSRLELAMQAADMAWWEMDLASGSVIFERRKADMLGFPPERFKHYLDFMALVHPDDRERAMNAMRGHLDGTLPRYEVDYRIATRSGEYKWFHDLGSIVSRDADGNPLKVTGLVINITERKLAEDALHEREAQLANALQMTKSGHWEYDVDRDLFTFNDNFYRIFQTTAAAVGGYQMPAAEYARRFCHPDDAPQVGAETRAAIASADPGYSRQIAHRFLYADGGIGYLAVRFFIVKDAHGRTIKTYGVNQDISKSKRAEEEIKRQLQEKETLLQEVHHRIKNNIATIGGILSLSMQRIASPEAIAALQDAIGRVDSMRVLYEKLLLSEDYQDISVKKYLESLTEAIMSLFPDQARIRLDQRFADFQLDPKRLFPLGIIINELLTNIMKYAFAGKTGGRIRLSLAKAGSRVTLVVQDNGVGLPDGFTVEGEKGFGLTLVKMLSQQLGGTFAIETRKGTRCTVAFDVRDAMPPGR